MAKPNYNHLKKQREAAKSKAKQEKLAKRQGNRLPEADVPPVSDSTPRA